MSAIPTAILPLKLVFSDMIINIIQMFSDRSGDVNSHVGDHMNVINLDLGRYDASRQFKIFDNVYVGQKFVELSKEFDVTLASQSSFDRLHWIIYVAKLWYFKISQKLSELDNQSTLKSSIMIGHYVNQSDCIISE